MTVNDMNWAEQGGVNTAFGFLFGTMVGGVKYCWTLAPGLHAEIFTAGSAVMAGLRNKNDSWNYGAGGAVLGAYASFNSHKGRTVHLLVSKIGVYSIAGVLAYSIGDKFTEIPAVNVRIPNNVPKIPKLEI